MIWWIANFFLLVNNLTKWYVTLFSNVYLMMTAAFLEIYYIVRKVGDILAPLSTRTRGSHKHRENGRVPTERVYRGPRADEHRGCGNPHRGLSLLRWTASRCVQCVRVHSGGRLELTTCVVTRRPGFTRGPLCEGDFAPVLTLRTTGVPYVRSHERGTHGNQEPPAKPGKW